MCTLADEKYIHTIMKPFSHSIMNKDKSHIRCVYKICLILIYLDISNKLYIIINILKFKGPC